MLEHARRCLLVVVVEHRQRAIEVLTDDSLSAAQLGESGGAEYARATCGLLVPEALHHQLEVGRLDSLSIAERGRLLEHGLDELGLDLDVLGCGFQLVPPLQWTQNGRSRRVTIEAVEPTSICEHVRNPVIQRTKSCELVLAHGQQNVRA